MLLYVLITTELKKIETNMPNVWQSTCDFKAFVFTASH